MDAGGIPVPDGALGEMAIRSMALFGGYWNNPDTNSDNFHGGWFHMGDVFRRNPGDHWSDVPIAFMACICPALNESDLLTQMADQLTRYKLPKQ